MKVIEGNNSKCQYKFEIKWQKFSGQAPYFSITGNTWELGKPRTDRNSLGCGALTLGDYVPEFAYLDKWHLCSTKQPMHYVANSLYFVSDRDYRGLLKGEKRQIKNGKTGLPCWQMMAVHKTTGEEFNLYDIQKNVDALECPQSDYNLEFRPWCNIGEGKEPDLEAARRAAKWSEANLEDFTEEKLTSRLPKLMEDFKKDIESIGLEWPDDRTV